MVAVLFGGVATSLLVMRADISCSMAMVDMHCTKERKQNQDHSDDVCRHRLEGLEYFCNQSHRSSVTKRGVPVKVNIVFLLFGDAMIQRIRRGR
jgi:hypothetical protein